MLKSTVVLLAAMASYAAEDAWAKVRAVKSGTEIRVVKRGAVVLRGAALQDLLAAPR